MNFVHSTSKIAQSLSTCQRFFRACAFRLTCSFQVTFDETVRLLYLIHRLRGPPSPSTEKASGSRSPDGDAPGIPRCAPPCTEKALVRAFRGDAFEHGEGFYVRGPAHAPEPSPRGEGGSRRLTDEVSPGGKPYSIYGFMTVLIDVQTSKELSNFVHRDLNLHTSLL